jgi:hypothetical protein
MKLTIRRNGKYYQIGYYQHSKWFNIVHLGTCEQLLIKLGIPLPETYQKVEPKKPVEIAETYQKNDDKEKSTFSEQIGSRFG